MCVSPIFKNTTNLEIRVKEKLIRECPRLILLVGGRHVYWWHMGLEECALTLGYLRQNPLG